MAKPKNAKNEAVQSKKELASMIRGALHGRNGHQEEPKASGLFTKPAVQEVNESGCG